MNEKNIQTNSIYFLPFQQIPNSHRSKFFQKHSSLLMLFCHTFRLLLHLSAFIVQKTEKKKLIPNNLVIENYLLIMLSIKSRSSASSSLETTNSGHMRLVYILSRNESKNMRDFVVRDSRSRNIMK